MSLLPRSVLLRSKSVGNSNSFRHITAVCATNINLDVNLNPFIIRRPLSFHIISLDDNRNLFARSDFARRSLSLKNCPNNDPTLLRHMTS